LASDTKYIASNTPARIVNPRPPSVANGTAPSAQRAAAITVANSVAMMIAMTSERSLSRSRRSSAFHVAWSSADSKTSAMITSNRRAA
jgi:hypothetical protein